MKSKSYQARLKAEVKHYKQIFKNKLFQEVPPVWNEVEARFSKKIEQTTGAIGLPAYVARHTKGRRKVKVLSLGSGACGVEILGLEPLLRAQGAVMELTSIDINAEVLAQAQQEAEKRKIKFVGIAQDINKLSLPKAAFDVVIAYASLHHFENLDFVTCEINETLKAKGIFVTVDIPTRNGYLLWDETREIIDSLWRVLPAKYKWDHTVSKVPIYLHRFPNVDYSIGSFECANSEAILPALRKNLREIDFVPAFSLARRFFDTKFGPNFDLRKSEAKNWFELIMQLDEKLLAGKLLKPETFFGAYGKKGDFTISV